MSKRTSQSTSLSSSRYTSEEKVKIIKVKKKRKVTFKEDVKYIATKWMPDRVRSFSSKKKKRYSEGEKVCREQTIAEVRKKYDQK